MAGFLFFLLGDPLVGYTNGVVQVNGKYLKDDQFRNVSAYVPQEDSLIGGCPCLHHYIF